MEATIKHNGVLIGQPVFLLTTEQPAEIRVSGTDGYTLSVVLSEQRDEGLQLTTSLLYKEESINPTLQILLNEQAKLKIEDFELSVLISEQQAEK